MLINVKVKPNSSKQEIQEFGNNRYLIYLKEPAEQNRANIELINLLSRNFGVPVSHIRIKTGLTNNEKLIEVS